MYVVYFKMSVSDYERPTYYCRLLTIGPSHCLELSLPESSFPDVDSATGLYVAEHTATTPDPYVQQQLQWKFLYIKTVEETVTCLLVVPLYKRSNKKQILACATKSGLQHVFKGKEFPHPAPSV